jgi:hypothetical protein
MKPVPGTASVLSTIRLTGLFLVDGDGALSCASILARFGSFFSVFRFFDAATVASG